MLKSLLTALGYLSVLPLGARFKKAAEGRESEVMVFFPLAGLLLGVGPAAVMILCSRLIGFHREANIDPLPAAIVILAMALLTGLSHLANLARTADALGSGKAGLEALAVADESRIGAYGAIAVGLTLLVKFSALMVLPAGKSVAFLPAGTVLAVLLASALGRWTAVVLAAYSEYARPEGGEDEWMVRYCGARELRWSLILTVVLVAGVSLAGLSGASLPWYRAALAAVGCFVLGYLASLYFDRRFGGITARQIGAVIEVGETLALALMCSLVAAQPLSAPPL